MKLFNVEDMHTNLRPGEINDGFPNVVFMITKIPVMENAFRIHSYFHELRYIMKSFTSTGTEKKVRILLEDILK